MVISKGFYYFVRMKKINPGLLLFILLTTTGNMFGQSGLMNNLGALIYTDPGAIVKVKGTFVNHTQGIFQNYGVSTIDSNFVNDALSEGGGFYRVGKDWVNNGTFLHDTSQVFLWGNNQFIRGDSVTTFWELELQGTGIKTQQINSYTANELRLNDRELATDTFFMHVTTSAPGAITRTTGFVSSLGNGKLYRNTNVTASYLFPTGSSLVVTRYRPAILIPNIASSNTYGVRMVNNNASDDGYERTLVDSFVCRTNPYYYHLIRQVGGSQPTDIRLFYDQAADSLWDGMAHWRTQPNNFWNDMSPVTHTVATPLSSVTRQAWTDFIPQPFILSRIRPAVPQISGLDTVCGSRNELYTASPDSASYIYNWGVSQGFVAATPTNNSAIVSWNTGGTPGAVALTVTAPNGCTSFPDSLPVLIYPEIIAAFNTSTNGVYGSEPIVFIDQSQNASVWNWNFGDTQESSKQNPTHIYNAPGSYTITLIATSPDGCLDTAQTNLTIIDGLIIPNVFTPDGDGINDDFEIKGSGFSSFKCSIFNRWGNLMFESSAAQIKWDGSTLSGTLASPGTYFVILEIGTLNGQTIEHKGTVTLVRKSE